MLVKINITKEDRETLREISEKDGRHIYKVVEMMIKEYLEKSKD